MYFIQKIRIHQSKGLSPTQKLLELWGHENHSVLELFALLRRMHRYKAMTIIKNYVDPMYHRYIKEEEPKPEVFMQNLQITDKESEKTLNIPPEQMSRENNQSVSNVQPKQKSPLVSNFIFIY